MGLIMCPYTHMLTYLIFTDSTCSHTHMLTYSHLTHSYSHMLHSHLTRSLLIYSLTSHTHTHPHMFSHTLILACLNFHVLMQSHLTHSFLTGLGSLRTMTKHWSLNVSPCWSSALGPQRLRALLVSPPKISEHWAGLSSMASQLGTGRADSKSLTTWHSPGPEHRQRF